MAGLSQEMLPAGGLRKNALLPNSVSGRRAQGNSGGAVQPSARIRARLAMGRVVFSEEKLLKRVQADTAADGSAGQLSIWDRR